MSSRQVFRIDSSVVCGALMASDGASAFDVAPVVLENMDPPGGLIEAREWDGAGAGGVVGGDALTSIDLKNLVRSGQAITFPNTQSPAHAVVWALRKNFPNREAALFEASVARVVVREHRLPGRRGEVVLLLVDASRGQRVLELWQSRMTAEGAMEWHAGEYVDARELFLASLAIGMRDVHDIYRVILVNFMVGDDGVETRVLAYANLAKRWAKKQGRGVDSLRESFTAVCGDLGVDYGRAAEWTEKVMGKGGER